MLFPFASIAHGMLNAVETNFVFGESARKPPQKEKTAPFVRTNKTATQECAVLFRKVQCFCFLSYSFHNTGVLIFSSFAQVKQIDLYGTSRSLCLSLGHALC